MKKLELQKCIVGSVYTNCYFLKNKETGELLIVDPGDAADMIERKVSEMQGKPVGILLTHGHFDHLLGVDKFKSEFGVDTYVSQDDLSQVKLAPDMMLMFAGEKIPDIGEITHFVKDGDEFSIGNTKIKAISTAGHTRGGMCYLIGDNLFSGDTLFRGSVGRCDLPEGDFRAIEKSIKEKLFKLPDETTVYTGHGDKTTIGYEKRFNEIVNV